MVQLGIGQGLPRTHLAIPLPYIFELLWKGWDLGELLRLPSQRLPNLDQAFPEGLLRPFRLLVEPELGFGVLTELLDLFAKKRARLLAT